MTKPLPESAEPLLDALIVGGGLVGLGLAAALGGAGLKVAVVDRERPATVLNPVFDGRVSAIAQGSRRILEAIGVWPKLAAEAEPILDIRVSEGSSLLFIHFDHREVADERGAEPLGHIVENRMIRKALFDRVAELDAVWLLAPMTVTKVARSAGRIEATLGDGRTLSAKLAISAEGRNSRLRADAGIPVTTWSYRNWALVCTVAHEFPHKGVAQERFLPTGPFAVLPMKDDALGTHRSSIVWTDHAEVIAHLMTLGDDDFNRELALRFGDYLGETAAFGKRWSYPLGLLHADSYVAERLALVGDAAHAIHPMAGQGLNLGIRDVAAIAEVLVDAHRLGLDIGHLSVLERFQRWRRCDNVTLAAVTDGLDRLFSNAFPPLRVARDLGLAGAGMIPPLRRFFMNHSMGNLGELPRLARGEPL
ncbi:MAG TPA: UbiH/UbiF/VisC/COQ6 family ubiquinone biosynthesis hydroxylase [Alphaproteobacteria bacterium]|jgi:2-octaprenyl-6-methoxyphenol hydroxylase|nr:UbiH/UbiF/VisC/COQ6 family ubiquinone biosynthesis hydroxylase [Alphaproteobacteria bacterium]